MLLAETGARPEAEAVPALARAARWRLPERVEVALLHRDTDGAAAAPAGTAPSCPGGPRSDTGPVSNASEEPLLRSTVRPHTA